MLRGAEKTGACRILVPLRYITFIWMLLVLHKIRFEAIVRWMNLILEGFFPFHTHYTAISFVNNFKYQVRFSEIKVTNHGIYHTLVSNLKVSRYNEINCDWIIEAKANNKNKPTVRAPVFGMLNSEITNFQTWFVNTVMEVLKTGACRILVSLRYISWC